MARLVTFKDLDNLVTNVGGPIVVSSGCERGQALIISGDNTLDLADTSVSRSLGRFIGVASSTVTPGSKVKYQYLGPFKMDASMGWSAGQPIYTDDEGYLTNVPPVSTTGKYIQVLGVALTDDTVFLFREPAYPF